MNLTSEEKETHISMVASNRKVWEIATDDEVMQRKLEKIGATFIREDFSGTTRFYTLPSNQVTLRRAVVMSDEQKALSIQRLRALRSRPEAAEGKGESRASDG